MCHVRKWNNKLNYGELLFIGAAIWQVSNSPVLIICCKTMYLTVKQSYLISYHRHFLNQNENIHTRQGAFIKFPGLQCFRPQELSSLFARGWWFGLTNRKQGRQMGVWGVHFRLCEAALSEHNVRPLFACSSWVWSCIPRRISIL